MVMLPMDVYKNLLHADGQQQIHPHSLHSPTNTTSSTPPQPQKQQQPKKNKRKNMNRGEIGYKRMRNNLLAENMKRRNERKQQANVVRQLLKSMSKSQLSTIAKNGKPKRKN